MMISNEAPRIPDGPIAPVYDLGLVLIATILMDPQMDVEGSEILRLFILEGEPVVRLLASRLATMSRELGAGAIGGDIYRVEVRNVLADFRQLFPILTNTHLWLWRP
jgi:hypothetical protein